MPFAHNPEYVPPNALHPLTNELDILEIKVKLLNLLALIATCLTLNACRVNLVDGKIPTKYVSLAQEKAGHYTGTFEGKAAELTLVVNNDGSADVNFNNANGDIIGTDCKSVIGDLNGLWATNKKVGGASFKLQTQCKILGKTVDLDFDRNEKLVVRVIRDSYEITSESCSGGMDTCDAKGNCTTSPTICFPETTTEYTYFSGKFQKK